MTPNTTFHGLNRKEAEALVWKYTHRDFRSAGTGERRIMILRNGYTSTVALVDLTEGELTERVEQALRDKHRKTFRDEGLVVYPRRAPWAGAVDLDGRAYVVNLLTGEKLIEAEPTVDACQEKRMVAAFRKSEAAADRLALVPAAASAVPKQPDHSESTTHV